MNPLEAMEHNRGVVLQVASVNCLTQDVLLRYYSMPDIKELEGSKEDALEKAVQALIAEGVLSKLQFNGTESSVCYYNNCWSKQYEKCIEKIE
jgi:hypothetical protein